MAEATRSIYFYQVQVDEGEVWDRGAVLDELAGLSGEDRYVDLEDGNVLFVVVDRVPVRAGEVGRLRLFKSRRSNLPAVEDRCVLSDLPIAESAGLAEPSHVVFAPDGLVVAEYNHFAPRMSALAQLIWLRTGRRVRFGTYIQGDVVEQLDRLGDIRLMELSVRPSPVMADLIGRDDPISAAIAAATRMPGERRVAVTLSGRPDSGGFTDTVRAFARRMVGLDVDEGHDPRSVFRVRGFDPATGEVEVVDLLRQKVVRRVRIEKSAARSRALDVTDAYRVIEDAVGEVREHDLPSARVV